MTVSSSASVVQGKDSGRGGGDSTASDRGMMVTVEEALFLLGAGSPIVGGLVSELSL